MRFVLPTIRHNRRGFAALANLHAQTEHCFVDDVEIDMRSTNRFDGDMCAAFGAILYSLGDSLNTVRLTNINSKVEKILSKNGFLSHYGGQEMPDLRETTDFYERFDVGDDRYFSAYIERGLIRRPEVPEMSEGLLKKFRESIFEIFSNAVLHSHTELGIFSCGQFFPDGNRLDFTVADLGIGIRKNIYNNLQQDLSPVDAIIWATQEHNTTKRDKVPGGLGLTLLSEFIDLNSGCIRIVSDAGYWRRKNRRTNTSLLDQPFPGTVVSVEINTADRSSYRLISESEDDEIF